MPTRQEVALGAIERIKRKANFTKALKPPMLLSSSPLSLDDTKIRLLTNSLRNQVKKDQPGETLTKNEVVTAKTVRKVVQMMIKKILAETLDDTETDKLVADVQPADVAKS